MIRFLMRLLSDDRGATAIEYGLLVAMIFLAIAAAMTSFAETNVEMWNLVATKMASS